MDSWKGYFYIHTNESARDYKILRCNTAQIEKLENFIPAKKETVIGGLDFLDEYILRSEKSDAIPKLYVRNIKTNKEEEINISNEIIGSPGAALMQKDTNTSKIRVSWESMDTPGRIYEYDIVSKEKKLVNKQSKFFFVQKPGLNSFIYKFAHNFSFLYGLVSVIVAIALGVGAGFIFRK